MYKGEIHLCFYQGTQMVGWGHGHGLIMDKHYRIVKSVEPASYQASSDMHEFKLIHDGKSALMTQYLRSVYDLCPWNLCDGLGYVNQGAFQEVDVETGEVIFEWRSLDHVGPEESYVDPSSTEISGSGETPLSPWDYFHINSIDKNDDGDYLISARHVSAVYKISGVDGHVIWRLNGARTDYYLDDFSFSFQHDARFISDNETHTVISLFDNGSNGFNQTQSHSTGQIISLDHRTKVASCLLNLDPPFVDGHAHISKSQGNFQLLPNGNKIMGWGNDAFWTEYGPDNEIVFYGNLGWSNVMNYRVHKFDNWVGLPLTKPALWAYSKEGDEMMMYVSWNGATEVKSWRFYGSDSRRGPWSQLSRMDKNGFETVYKHDKTWSFVHAKALDKNDIVLGTSAVEATFFPNEKMLEYCDDLACRFMPSAEVREQEQEAKAKAAAEAKAEAEATAQRAKEEKEAKEAQEEQERLAREAAQRKAHARLIRNAEIFGGTFGGLAVLLIVLGVLATRNFVSRPVHVLAHHVWSAVRLSRDSGRDSISGYKAISTGEEDRDEVHHRHPHQNHHNDYYENHQDQQRAPMMSEIS